MLKFDVNQTAEHDNNDDNDGNDDNDDNDDNDKDPQHHLIYLQLQLVQWPLLRRHQQSSWMPIW